MECHLKTHYKTEHRCRICQAAWASRAELERHARTHRLGNHYRCEQCGYLAKTANKLIEHGRVHTGERPFHCDRCSYSCKRKDNLNLHKRLKHAPRHALGCARCPFTTTHPFVYSRHVRKHQAGEGSTQEEAQAAFTPRPLSADAIEPFFLPDGSSSSPLMSLSASQALQSVALSVSGMLPATTPSPHYLCANGASPTSSPTLAAHYIEQYRTSDPAHLIPLTTLFSARRRFTFHAPSPFSRLWPRPSSQTSPLHISPKHSFLAYLGLTERAKTV